MLERVQSLEDVRGGSIRSVVRTIGGNQDFGRHNPERLIARVPSTIIAVRYTY